MDNDNILKKPRVNPEDYIDAPRMPFKKGNPGRPVGCLNKDTRARNEIMEVFLRRKDELTTIEFKQLLNAIVALLPKKLQGEGFASKDYTFITYGSIAKEQNNLNPGRSLQAP